MVATGHLRASSGNIESDYFLFKPFLCLGYFIEDASNVRSAGATSAVSPINGIKLDWLLRCWGAEGRGGWGPAPSAAQAFGTAILAERDVSSEMYRTYALFSEYKNAL